MPNYGDVALGLKADWNRNKYDNNSDWMLYTVGHDNGTPDAFITKEPDKRHQFRWVDFHDYNEITKAELQHYQFVRQETWTKHPILWQWDGEGYCYFAGQRLMARDESYWQADQARREQLHKQGQADTDRDIESVPDGLIATDAQGQPVRRRGRPRKGI